MKLIGVQVIPFSIHAETNKMEKSATQKPVVVTPPSQAETPKKTRKRSYEDMIIMAIKGLGEHRNGCSLKMIKDYFITVFEVPLDTKPSSLRHFKVALEKAVTKERIKRLTGRGLTGSFQLVNSGKSPFKTSTSKSPRKKATSTPTSRAKESSLDTTSPIDESPSFLDTTSPAESSFFDTTAADFEDNQDDDGADEE